MFFITDFGTIQLNDDLSGKSKNNYMDETVTFRYTAWSPHSQHTTLHESKVEVLHEKFQFVGWGVIFGFGT